MFEGINFSLEGVGVGPLCELLGRWSLQEAFTTMTHSLFRVKNTICIHC